jgi:serine/threonine protein kinase
VHRARLRGLDVAIKVLDAGSMQGQREFEREVQVLGSLHHPHLLPLLGSCPELHALVYPFMEKGSLQRRLYGRPGAAAAVGQAAQAAAPAAAHVEPLPWWDHARIAHETVLALVWLHGQQPSILHMDVKPDNILLDRCGRPYTCWTKILLSRRCCAFD